ncbi:MAG: protoporphyrinogen oxidase [Bacteroidales bacterium]
MRRTHTAIIGGGISGLTVAHDLHKQSVDYVLIDRETELGGVVRTVTKGEFTFETGPNTAVLSNYETACLLQELEGVNISSANEGAKKRLIMYKGKWEALPSSLFSYISTPLFSTKDKFRIWREPFLKRGDNPNESLAEFVRRRMGESYLRNAIDPFVSGVYGGNPHGLITRLAFKKLYALEQDYGSMIRGAIKKRKENKKNPEYKGVTKEIFSTGAGLQGVVRAISDSLDKTKIFCSTQLKSIDALNNGFKIVVERDGVQTTIIADNVVSTISSYELSKLENLFTPEEKKMLNDVKYADFVLVNVGYAEWQGDDINSFGGLIPSAENIDKFLGILFPSSMYADRAPKGGALLALFMGGVRNPDILKLSDEVIKNEALQFVSKYLRANNAPTLLEVKRHQRVIPQYELEIEQVWNMIKAKQCQHKGLYIGGSFIDGIGLPDRIKQGRMFAKMIRGNL